MSAASSSASSSAASAAPAVRTRDRSQEMVLFDIETNIFPIEIIEFGAIVVDKFSYVELERCHTMIQPPSGSISSKATKIHGITFEHVKHAPFFAAVAPRIFDALDGRVWVGHNINSFDVPHILKAFETDSLAPPKPSATLDTLPLVRRIFGKRAGDCKMATLGAYFGLGVEKHRAVEDSEMTLQALKCIGLHNLLEREMPDTFPPFVEADKKEPKPKPAAAVADQSVDKLADALAGGLAIDASEKQLNVASKPKKEKKQSDSIDAKKPLSPTATPFIDSSLLGATVPASSKPSAVASAPTSSSAPGVSSSSSAVAPASPRKEQKEDDGWQVQHSKKAVKAEQKSIKDQEAAAQAIKARKEKQQQKSQSAGLPQPQRERSSSVGSNSSGKGGNNNKQQESASSWSNKVKATIPPGGVKLEPSSSSLAPNPLSRSASDQQKPSSSSAAAASTAASSSSAAPITAASVSPVDRNSLHSTIDYYVANPHLRCELSYAGGKHPDKTKIITNFTWERRPVLFKALLEGNSHGNELVFFSVTKIVSLTLLP